MRKKSPNSTLKALTPDTLVTVTGGVLPKGYDEALAAGEKARQQESRQKLLD